MKVGKEKVQFSILRYVLLQWKPLEVIAFVQLYFDHMKEIIQHKRKVLIYSMQLIL